MLGGDKRLLNRATQIGLIEWAYSMGLLNSYRAAPDGTIVPTDISHKHLYETGRTAGLHNSTTPFAIAEQRLLY